jgi:hypothetical protein
MTTSEIMISGATITPVWQAINDIELLHTSAENRQPETRKPGAY